MSGRGQRDMSQASSAIAQTLAMSNLAQALRPHMAKVYWAAVVGPQVAGATQVKAIRSGSVLVVLAKNSVWANELSLLKQDIMTRLNRAIGGKVLTDIRFEIGAFKEIPAEKPAHMVAGPRQSDLDAIGLEQGTNARIAAVAGEIADTELRQLVRRALVRVAQTDEWKRANGWTECSVCRSLTEPNPDVAMVETPIVCDVCRIESQAKWTS